ncbi:hypothetical protein HanIR_Chr17g0861951 [Helianthus annuus]|nr:hypothetical protein HanIR_Chr17g0861951 [Helianthus annuus]
MVSSTFGAADLGTIERRGGEESGEDWSDIRWSSPSLLPESLYVCNRSMIVRL